MDELGDAVLALAASSQLEFVMCAPFAKQAVVSRIVSALPEGTNLKLYTRWRPEEIAAGVSDTGVLAALQSRGGTVFLHDRLHAKFYRNETRVLIGSANLTGTALGWAVRPNIELLSEVEAAAVVQVEDRLATESIEATSELAAEVEDLAKALKLPVNTPIERLQDVAEVEEEAGIWLPTLRIPGDLYLAYSRGREALSSRSSAAAALDLEVLDLPQGLSKEQFYLLVGHRMRQQPLVRSVDEFLTQPRRFGEVRDKIDQLIPIGRNRASDAWQTLMRWLLEFLPDRYDRQVPRHSELFARRLTAREELS